MAGCGGVDSVSRESLKEELVRASGDGDFCKVKYLVEVQHLDPRLCADAENDATSLHWASLYGHLDTVKYLVEQRSCDVECRDKYGDTPLHRAALGGRVKDIYPTSFSCNTNPQSQDTLGRGH